MENAVLMTVHLPGIGPIVVDVFWGCSIWNQIYFTWMKTGSKRTIIIIGQLKEWHAWSIGIGIYMCVCRMYVGMNVAVSSKHQLKFKDSNQFKRIEVKSNITCRRARVGIWTENIQFQNDWKNFLTQFNLYLHITCSFPFSSIDSLVVSLIAFLSVLGLNFFSLKQRRKKKIHTILPCEYYCHVLVFLIESIKWKI